MNYNIKTRSVWVVLEISAKDTFITTQLKLNGFFIAYLKSSQSLWYKARAFK